MTEYYYFYAYLFLVSSIDLFSSRNLYFKKLENKLLLLTWIVLIIFIGFRYKLGNDWYSYEQIINSIPPLFHSNVGEDIFFGRNIEFGFVILISFINELFNDSSDRLQALVFVISFINYSILIYVVYKIDSIRYKLLFISIYIGFAIFRDFDLLRQSISLYIFILSILYIKNRPLIYFGLNIFGSLFHVSSLVFLPIYYFLNTKTQKSTILIPYIFSILLFVLNEIMNSNLIIFLLNFLPSFINEKIVFLLSNSSQSFLSTTLLLNLIISFLLLLFFKKLRLNDYYVNLFIKLFVAMFLINILFLGFNELQERFSYFFYFTLSFLLIMLVDIFKKYSKFLAIFYISTILFLPIVRFDRVISGNGFADLVFTPYRNYLLQNNYSEASIYFNWNEKNNTQ